ncbi:hypothetical protein BLNAU_19848 [Blattamonas nauphoetae]|uniref:Uncharacterized protein n=1 Tax=Blattamonas nauphoetae TaxID=2049346 RepID=A0ABQ9X0W3_9EUKA|nr:hypothetical protein BLNAU_19848 [Blattamonas nauphoetae]
MTDCDDSRLDGNLILQFLFYRIQLGHRAAIHAIFQPSFIHHLHLFTEGGAGHYLCKRSDSQRSIRLLLARGAYSGVYIAGYHVCVVAMGVLYGNVYASNPLLSVKVTDSLTITNVAFSDSSLLTAPTLLSVVSGGTVTANSLSLLSLSSVNISYISLNAATTAQVNVGSITFNVLSAQTRSRPTSISPSQERRVCRFNLSYDNSPFRHILIVTALFTVPANNLIVTQATISSPLLESDTMITPFAIVSGGTAKQTNVVLDGSVLAARFAHSMLIQTGGSLSLNSCTFNSITTSDEGQRSSALTILKPAPLPTTKAATHTHTNGAFDIPSGTLTLKRRDSSLDPSGSICLFVENTADCGGAVEDFSISVLDDEFIVTIVDKVPVTNQTEINSKTLTICGNRISPPRRNQSLCQNSTFEGIVPVSLKEFPSLRVYFVVEQDAGVRQVDTSATVTITPAQSESHFYNSQTKNVQTVLSEDQTEYVAYVTGSQLIPCETATAVLFETTDVPSDVAFHNNTLIIVQISNDDMSALSPSTHSRNADTVSVKFGWGFWMEYSSSLLCSISAGSQPAPSLRSIHPTRLARQI